MTDGAIHQMSSAIGGLQADVRSLKDSIDSLNRVWGEREVAADAGRHTLHDKVDMLGTEVALLSAEVENVSNDLTKIKPAIDVFKAASDRQAGAQWMGKLIWFAFIGIAGGATTAVIEFFRRMH